jgi:hypothetical protein
MMRRQGDPAQLFYEIYVQINFFACLLCFCCIVTVVATRGYGFLTFWRPEAMPKDTSIETEFEAA